jgi:hypothetical protein
MYWFKLFLLRSDAEAKFESFFAPNNFYKKSGLSLYNKTSGVKKG